MTLDIIISHLMTEYNARKRIVRRKVKWELFIETDQDGYFDM